MTFRCPEIDISGLLSNGWHKRNQLLFPNHFPKFRLVCRKRQGKMNVRPSTKLPADWSSSLRLVSTVWSDLLPL